MVSPAQPENVRVIYPDGTSRSIPEIEYRGCYAGVHVWFARNPRFVPWVPDMRIVWDAPDGDRQITVVVGIDY